MAITKRLIASQTLGSNAATVTFSGIPADHDDLLVVISARCDGSQSQGWQDTTILLNGLSTDRSGRRLYGTGSSVGSTADTAYFFINNNNSTSNTFSNVELYFPNYAGPTAKSFSCSTAQENNGTAAIILAAAGLWNSTSAINSLTFDPSSGNFLTGSSFYLYGISHS